jgi:hypothetical protein
MSRNRFSSFLCLLLLVPLVGYAQFAQRGSLEGFVFDSTGASVPGAQVTLLDLAQKATEKAVTDGSGHFVFSNIAAGQYQLSASRDSFKTEQSAPIAVNIGSTAHYDFKLAVGQVATTVPER